MQHILYLSGKLNENALAMISEHGATIIKHCRSIEIRLPEGTIQGKTIQVEDSLPEAGISAKEETMYYILPSGLPIIYRREKVMTPTKFQTLYDIAVNLRALSSMLI